MKRFLVTISFAVLMLSVSAKTVSDVFLSVPDSIMPYMNKAQRIELLKIKSLDPTEPAVGHTVFQTEVKLYACTDEMICIEILDGITMEIGRLFNGSDSVFCVLKTVCTPEKSTVAYIIDSNWCKQSVITFDYTAMLHKPDAISEAEYEVLLKLIEFPLVEAHFAEDTPTMLHLALNVPLLSNEEKERLKQIILQTNLNWNGKSFK